MRLSAFALKVIPPEGWWDECRRLHGIATASASVRSEPVGVYGVHYRGEPTASSRQRANRATKRGMKRANAGG